MFCSVGLVSKNRSCEWSSTQSLKREKSSEQWWIFDRMSIHLVYVMVIHSFICSFINISIGRKLRVSLFEILLLTTKWLVLKNSACWSHSYSIHTKHPQGAKSKFKSIMMRPKESAACYLGKKWNIDRKRNREFDDVGHLLEVRLAGRVWSDLVGEHDNKQQDSSSQIGKRVKDQNQNNDNWWFYDSDSFELNSSELRFWSDFGR